MTTRLQRNIRNISKKQYKTPGYFHRHKWIVRRKEKRRKNRKKHWEIKYKTKRKKQTSIYMNKSRKTKQANKYIVQDPLL